MTNDDRHLIAIASAAAIVAAWRVWVTPHLNANPDASATTTRIFKWLAVGFAAFLIGLAIYMLNDLGHI